MFSPLLCISLFELLLRFWRAETARVALRDEPRPEGLNLPQKVLGDTASRCDLGASSLKAHHSTAD
jgi:hypothetical protein